MKRIISLILCLFYTFISFGGSIYVHQCSGDVSVSIYNKESHTNCPLCHKKSNSTDLYQKSCADGNCKDIEIVIDQISDQQVNLGSILFELTSPAILILHWIDLKPIIAVSANKITSDYPNWHFADSSPPYFLLNCTFLL